MSASIDPGRGGREGRWHQQTAGTEALYLLTYAPQSATVQRRRGGAGACAGAQLIELIGDA